MIRRTSLLACTVVLTLSVGIGIITAVFSLLNGFVFRRAVNHDPESFFRVLKGDRDESAVATFPQYIAFRDQAHSARELAAWSAIPLKAPLGSDDAAGVRGTLVSCNFFKVFGVEAPLAGGLLRADDCYSAHTVMVISERLWRDRFSADPAIAGESLLYGGRPLTIIGVAAAPFLGVEDVADVWFPYTIQPYLKDSLTVSRERDLLRADDIAWLNLAGRLRSGYSREAATAEFRLMASQLDQPNFGPDRTIVLTNGSPWGFAPLSMLGLCAVSLALPTLVLLIACVNAAASAARRG